VTLLLRLLGVYINAAHLRATPGTVTIDETIQHQEKRGRVMVQPTKSSKEINSIVVNVIDTVTRRNHPAISTRTTPSRRDGIAAADVKADLLVGVEVGHHEAVRGHCLEVAVFLVEGGEETSHQQDIDRPPYQDHDLRLALPSRKDIR
jgi:hypothetical protein